MDGSVVAASEVFRPPIQSVVSSGGGLVPSVQGEMEPKLGADVSDVRVHTGPRANKAAEAIDARAFTVGNHVAFNSGAYDPSSPEGKHTIAHELAHVRQQADRTRRMVQRAQQGGDVEVSDPSDPHEKEAERVAREVVAGGSVTVDRLEDGPGVQRQEQSSGSGGGGFQSFENGDLAEVIGKLKENQQRIIEQVDGVGGGSGSGGSTTSSSSGGSQSQSGGPSATKEEGSKQAAGQAIGGIIKQIAENPEKAAQAPDKILEIAQSAPDQLMYLANNHQAALDTLFSSMNPDAVVDLFSSLPGGVQVVLVGIIAGAVGGTIIGALREHFGGDEKSFYQAVKNVTPIGGGEGGDGGGGQSGQPTGSGSPEYK
ncbi:hypothetical protein BRD00_13830 [Halobacteriales archaeon QS_8_69_26]|nr:MAG: hypothetical protein BRD00_13830 [Halobacteriales archaeon QS_8_69_26]